MLEIGKTYAGYRLEEKAGEGASFSYRAVKAGEPFFFKAYIYERESRVTPEVHEALQERIAHDLASLNRVTEDLVEHGILEGELDAERDWQPDVYYQVKLWLDADDLSFWNGNRFNQLIELQGARDGTGVLRWLVEQLLMAKKVAGVVRRYHRKGIVHQDLKAEQFMVIGPGQLPMVADFDWSFYEGEEPLQVVTTPGYQSPEHVRGDVPSLKSDVFTLGVILYKLFWRSMWPTVTPEKQAGGVFQEDLEEGARSGRYAGPRLAESWDSTGVLGLFEGRQRTWAKEVLAGLDDVVDAALKPDEAQRPTADEIWDRLDAIPAEPPIAAGPLAEPGRASEVRKDEEEAEAMVRPVRAAFLRLRVEDEPDDMWDIRLGLDEDHLQVTRRVAKRQFGSLASREGHPFYRFLDADVPWVAFEQRDGGWYVCSPAGTTNGCRLQRLEDGALVDIGEDPYPVAGGDRLLLHWTREDRVLEECPILITVK